MKKGLALLSCLVLVGCIAPIDEENADGGAGVQDAGPGGGGGGGGQGDAGGGGGQDGGVNPNIESKTIQQIQTGDVAENTELRIDEAVVTAVVSDQGFFIQQGSGNHSGIFVYGPESTATEGLVRGARVTLTGTYVEFASEGSSTSQLAYPTVEVLGADGVLPEPLRLEPSALLGEGAELYEGVLVTIGDVEILNANPDEPGDFGEIEVTGGLRIDDYIYGEMENGGAFVRMVGTRFSSITGIGHESFGHRKLLPRDADDLVLDGDQPDPPATEVVAITAIQDGTVEAGRTVTVERGIVTAVVTGRATGFWIQQGGGPYSGIYVYVGNRDAQLPQGLEQGSRVDVTGRVAEYQGSTQLQDPVVVVGDSGALPEPESLQVVDLVTDNTQAEQWEGVLVSVTNVTISEANPDGDNDYGEFVLAGGLRVDDYIFDDLESGELFPREVGTQFNRITGIAHESYGNKKLLPREATDITLP